MTAANGSSCIHTVTPDDPPFYFHRGEGFERHRLPAGTRVIYPNPCLDALPDNRAAVIEAIDNPLGADPLDAQLKAGMKVTIAFDDVSLPLPAMASPDIRRTIIELLIERLDRAGVTDIELICAICLHRRCTPKELKHMVGPVIFDRFWPDKLYNHDAEDPEAIVHLGKTEKGEDVELNKRAVESDLLIYVNINLVTMDGGHKSVPVGLSTYKSVRHHHDSTTLLHESSYMDPPNSDIHNSFERMWQITKKQLNIFQIETTLNANLFHNMLGFLKKREHDWSLFDHLNFKASAIGLKMLPGSLRRKAYNALPAPYGLTGVHAGDTELVHAKTLAGVHRQQLVDVPDQADIVIVGLPSIGPYNVNSILNPILVHCMACGYFFNFFRNTPYVRKGGVMIVLHPLENKWNLQHHPSYYRLWEEGLTQTRDPHELERRFEKKYVEDERLIDLYRNDYAYHPAHAFYMWNWGAHGAAHLGKVIAVNPVSEMAARRMDYEVAPTLNSAIGMAKDIAGQDASVCYFHCPPMIVCDMPA